MHQANSLKQTVWESVWYLRQRGEDVPHFCSCESGEQSISVNQIGSFCRSTSYSRPMISAPHLLFTDAVISFSPGLTPATTGCQRPEAYLTALRRALQATRLTDCCNMLHISPGPHTEYNHCRVPHQSLAKPHPRSLLLR